MERIIPANLDDDELHRRNGEYVDAASHDAAVARIAELEAAIKSIRDEIASVGLMLAYHEPGKPTLAIRPGQYELLKKTFGL